MAKVVCDRATGEIITYQRLGVPAHDVGKEVVIDIDRVPNKDQERWDTAQGLRPFTPQEQAAREDKRKDLVAQQISPEVLALVDLINQERTQPITQPMLIAAIKGKL